MYSAYFSKYQRKKPHLIHVILSFGQLVVEIRFLVESTWMPLGIGKLTDYLIENKSSAHPPDLQWTKKTEDTSFVLNQQCLQGFLESIQKIHKQKSKFDHK